MTLKKHIYIYTHTFQVWNMSFFSGWIFFAVWQLVSQNGLQLKVTRNIKPCWHEFTAPVKCCNSVPPRWLEPLETPRLATCKKKTVETSHTVDGRNPANRLRLIVDPIIYRVLYVPGGCFGISEPSTGVQSPKRNAEGEPGSLRTMNLKETILNGIFRDPQGHGTPLIVTFPYCSHTTPMFESLKIWEWYGSRLPCSGVPCPWGSLKSPLKCCKFRHGFGLPSYHCAIPYCEVL